jgi:hypothetical protein
VPADERPSKIHVLDGAQALAFVALDSLPAVVRALTPVGSVVVVQYDDVWNRLTFYRQDAWLPGNRIPAANDHDPSTEEEFAAPESANDRRDTLASANAPPGEPHITRPWQSGDYEDEGSEWHARGSVSEGRDAWWSATLVVPMTGGSDIVFVQLERSGHPLIGYRGDTTIDFSLPVAEVDDVPVLLLRLVAQARRDGVLPSLTADAADS